MTLEKVHNERHSTVHAHQMLVDHTFEDEYLFIKSDAKFYKKLYTLIEWPHRPVIPKDACSTPDCCRKSCDL